MTTTTAKTVSAYFASGSNHPAEIRGFARVGQDVGVAAPELNHAAEAELVKLSGSNVKVFIDSGAFSEVAFNAPHKCFKSKKCKAGKCIGDGNLPYPDTAPFTFATVKPITILAWSHILSLYIRLASALGDQLFVVAPDKVGDQQETLSRLNRFASVLRAIKATGANILVPIQKGELTQADFVSACAKALGFDDFVHAMPCKKGATTMKELADYVAEVKPARMHLLGMGLKNRGIKTAMAIIGNLSPETDVTCDSCLITATVGRTNGPGGGPRLMTRCLDLAKELIAAGKSKISHHKELAIVLAFGPDAERYQSVASQRIQGAQMELPLAA
jgi:hypothetical protein